MVIQKQIDRLVILETELELIKKDLYITKMAHLNNVVKECNIELRIIEQRILIRDSSIINCV